MSASPVVSNMSIFFMVISLIIQFLFPIALAVYFYRKEKISIKAIFIGALVFFVFQIITRIPLLSLLQITEWYRTMATQNLLALSLFLGLTAGLFEEVGRFLGFKYLLRNNLERKNGIAFGIGHGGIESMYIGLTFINNIVLSLMLNSGTFDTILKDQLPAQTLNQIKDALVNTPPATFALSGLERLFTIFIQIALSLIVLYAVKYRKNIYLLFAILLHTLINAPLIYLQKYLGIYGAEVYVALCAVLSIVFIIKSKNWFAAANTIDAS